MQSKICQVNGVNLHYLDWGGTGEPMVWLAGMRCTADIFIDIAPQFTDQFRVVALTRRGHGLSEKPATGYEIDTLTEDLYQFLQFMQMTKVTLVGHSLAGAELTRLAQLHPEVVAQLIYLDAAYDHTLPAVEAPAQLSDAYAPTPADQASLDQYRAWFQKWVGFWSPAQEADFLACYTTAPDGTVQGQMPEEVTQALFALKWPSDFSTITAPALAIFAQQWDYYAELFDQLGLATDVQQAARTYFAAIAEQHYYPSVAKFRREMRNGRVVELEHTHHNCFIHRQEAVIHAMQTFLAET